MNIVDLHVHMSLTDPHGTCGDAACQTLLADAKAAGVTSLVLTPHVSAHQDTAHTIADMTQTIAQLSAMDKPTLYAGSEFLIHSLEDVVCPEQGLIPTINNTKYLAIEFLPRAELSLMCESIYELKLRGFNPILVHPERLSAIQKRPHQAAQLLGEGALLQGTLGCLTGNHGTGARRVLLKLLDEGYISLLASDFHKGSYLDLYKQSLPMLERQVGLVSVEQLLSANPQKVLTGKPL